MKSVKFFLFFSFVLISTASFSQLKVDSSGKTLFGSKVYNNGISIVDERAGATTVGVPFRITRQGSSSSNDNVYFTRSTTSLSRGLAMYSNGNIAIGDALPTNWSSSRDIPLSIYTQSASAGLVLNLDGQRSDGIIINMTTPTGNRYIIDYYESATNSFYVKDDGKVYARSVLLTSDASLKSEIETLKNPLEKLLQLRGVSYYMDGIGKTDATPFDELLLDMKKRNPKMTQETLKQMQDEKKRKNIGVIAQEVEKILPEAVSTREDGIKAVSYSDLTVLLIEAVKEQQTIIDNLKLEVAAIKGSSLRSLSDAAGISNDLIAACKLSQNAPNPFTEQTEIKYYVADGVKDAFICVFDMQGKMLQKLDVKSGQNSLFIEGSKLEAGMYLYSLIVDGQEVDTKK